MTSVDRARQALTWLDGKDDAKFDADTPVVSALRDLLAEIDAGHWVDTRELAALADAEGIAGVICEDRERVGTEHDPGDGRWIVEYGVWGQKGRRDTGYWPTATEAIRAAREAARG